MQLTCSSIVNPGRRLSVVCRHLSVSFRASAQPVSASAFKDLGSDELFRPSVTTRFTPSSKMATMSDGSKFSGSGDIESSPTVGIISEWTIRSRPYVVLDYFTFVIIEPMAK